MSYVILSMAGLMFLVPMVVMVVIAIFLGQVPDPILSVGGWSMALGVVTGGIGAAINLSGG